MEICKRCVVSGRVQGVFFRHSTQKKALALGVKGWVRNLSNGDVECFLYGEQTQVEELCKWLHRGPAAAKVIQVTIEEAPFEVHIDFVVLR